MVSKMIAPLREISVLKEITYLDPEVNGDPEYFRVRDGRVTIWQRARQFACSPSVITVAILMILLMAAADLPS